jgi:hypothetical protein
MKERRKKEAETLKKDFRGPAGSSAVSCGLSFLRWKSFLLFVESIKIQILWKKKERERERALNHSPSCFRSFSLKKVIY